MEEKTLKELSRTALGSVLTPAEEAGTEITNLEELSDEELDAKMEAAASEWANYGARMSSGDAKIDAEREKAKRKAEERRIKGEQARAEYARKIAMLDALDKPGGMEWFMRNLESNSKKRVPVTICREYEKDMVEYLNAAYQDIVVSEEYCTMDCGGSYKKVIRDMARWCISRKRFGLMMMGNVGVGKTTMMKAIAKCYRILEKKDIEIVSAEQITALARDNAAAFYAIADKPMLGIDDLGVEPRSVRNYGNEYSPMCDLIERRYDKKQFTLITTNLTREEISEIYGVRVWDRLLQLCGSYTFDTSMKSYRK